jgi:ATP-dependent Lon protease
VEFKESDLHVHFPAGAIPKDGPSAGAAVTLAIASVLSRRPVRRDIALTGEMTLRGKVLEIGGVKEKVMAAYRAGLRQVILPKANEKDLRGIPDEVVNSMMFTFVSTMDDIIHMALLPKGPGTLADALEPHGDVEAKNSVLDSNTASINQSSPAGAVTQ